MGTVHDQVQVCEGHRVLHHQIGEQTARRDRRAQARIDATARSRALLPTSRASSPLRNTIERIGSSVATLATTSAILTKNGSATPNRRVLDEEQHAGHEIDDQADSDGGKTQRKADSGT